MIIFNILLDDEEKAGRISSFLITERYALRTHVDTNTVISAQGEHRTIRLFFITKALLYATIEELIHKHFFSSDMVIYATPVSHVNEEFGKVLREEIKAV